MRMKPAVLIGIPNSLICISLEEEEEEGEDVEFEGKKNPVFFLDRNSFVWVLFDY